MPNYLTLVIHVYPAKVSLRPVRLGNGLCPLPPSPAGLVSNRHPTRRCTGSSTGLHGPGESHEVSQDSRTPHRPVSNRSPLDSKTRTLHILNLPGQIHTMQYHVLAYTELPRQSLSRNRHPNASWSHPTSAQVCGTYTHSERRTPSPSRTLFQRS